MILHQPDRTMGRLKSCWRRAASFARQGQIDNSHPLAAAWSNCKLFLEAREQSRAPSVSEQAKEDGAELAFDASCLDWFAERLDRYAQNNMLAGDMTVAAILFEWRGYMPFNPAKKQ